MVKAVAMFVLVMATGPALAGPPVSSDAKANDPKRKICEAVEETGSRLGSKRICMTAEQWAAQNRDTRDSGKRSEKPSGDGGGK